MLKTHTGLIILLFVPREKSKQKYLGGKKAKQTQPQSILCNLFQETPNPLSASTFLNILMVK